MIGEILRNFPVEEVPDATAWAPHHGIYGGIIALITAFLVVHWYKDRDPIGVIFGTTLGLFGFLFVWEWYPKIGAAMALGGYTLAFLSAINPWGQWWRYYPDAYHATVVAGLFIGLDDVIDHALPVPTPLDTMWAILGPWPSTVLALVFIGSLVYLLDQAGPTEVEKKGS